MDCVMVDPDRVRSKLVLLERFRNRLEVLAALDPGVYEGAHAYEGRYLVQASAQICIDLAHHVIASAGWTTVTQYRDAFPVLAGHGVISEELAARMQDLAGLRNRLVHMYDDIDDGLVQDGLRSGLGDLDDFAAGILTRLQADEDG